MDEQSYDLCRRRRRRRRCCALVDGGVDEGEAGADSKGTNSSHRGNRGANKMEPGGRAETSDRGQGRHLPPPLLCRRALSSRRLLLVDATVVEVLGTDARNAGQCLGLLRLQHLRVQRRRWLR